MDIKPKRNKRGLRTLGTAIVSGLLHSLPLSAQDDFVYWPRLDFVIPFQIDSNGQVPQEVILEVSEDAGGSWKTCSRGDTRSRQFHYKASQDGAFQFRLKTVDAEGRKFNNPGEPLKIIVDTSKPIAKLRTFMDQQGKMQAEFLLSDKDLDVNSIRLEYQTESVPEWKSIPFAVEESTTIGEWTGYGDWNLPNNAKQLVVRIIATDKAGNTTEEIRLPNLPKTASSKNMQLASQLRATDPGRLVTKDSDAPTAIAIGSGVSNNIEGLPRVEVAGRPELANPIEPPNKNKNKLSGSGEKQTDPNKIRAELLQEYQLLVDQQQKLLQQKRIVETQQKLEIESHIPTDSRGLSSQGSPISFGNRATEGQELATTPSSILLDGQPSFPRIPATSNESTHSLPPLDTQRSKPNNGLDRPGAMGIDMSPSNKPAGGFSRDIKPLYSNTKTFSLDYRVDNEPGAPIRDVELWGTTDQGQTWSVWGSDPDRRTPFDIEVETDGLFGFRMVIIGSNGLASNRPRNGDNADAWIHVDTDTPYAELTSALYGTGSEVGSLIIAYHAKDEYFGDRPISLFFGETPEGPWQVISRSIRNQGRFAWPADPNLPPTIYLKMEAIDAAGNIATSILDLPVNVEGIAPRGRIQGFRPIQRQ
jgi:hypothetical protein